MAPVDSGACAGKNPGQGGDGPEDAVLLVRPGPACDGRPGCRTGQVRYRRAALPLPKSTVIIRPSREQEWMQDKPGAGIGDKFGGDFLRGRPRRRAMSRSPVLRPWTPFPGVRRANFARMVPFEGRQQCAGRSQQWPDRAADITSAAARGRSWSPTPGRWSASARSGG